MATFMDCICDNNLSSLDLSGKATEAEIADAWISLFYEYCDLIEATETKKRTKLLAEITRDEKKIEVATVWVKVIELAYSKDLATALQVIGFDFPLEFGSPQFAGDIARIKAELRDMAFDLKIKKAHYASILETDNTNTTHVVTRKGFEQKFQAINDYKKWNAVNEQSTVLTFCVALKSYNDLNK